MLENFRLRGRGYYGRRKPLTKEEKITRNYILLAFFIILVIIALLYALYLNRKKISKIVKNISKK